MHRAGKGPAVLMKMYTGGTALLSVTASICTPLAVLGKAAMHIFPKRKAPERLFFPTGLEKPVRELCSHKRGSR